MWFRNLDPILKVGIILVAAAFPFFVFVLTRAGDPVEPPLEPLPTDSPDTPLVFPFGTLTTTSSTQPVSSTISTTGPRIVQCNDGRDNDRDRRIDLRDPGCRNRLDNSEFNAVATTRPRVTTRPPATTTRPPTTAATTTRAPTTAPVTTTNSPTAN